MAKKDKTTSTTKKPRTRRARSTAQEKEVAVTKPVETVEETASQEAEAAAKVEEPAPQVPNPDIRLAAMMQDSDPDGSSPMLEEQFRELAQANEEKAAKLKLAEDAKTVVVEGVVVEDVAVAPEPEFEMHANRVIAHLEHHDGRTRRITALDDPAFGAQHEYMLEVQEVDPGSNLVVKPFRGDLSFQKGPLVDGRPNGWNERDLLEILIDRYTCFSNSCSGNEENKKVLRGLLSARAAMEARRSRRVAEIKAAQAAKEAEAKAKAREPKPIIF